MKRKILYGMLVLLAVVTFYSIFNTGNPASLWRFLIKDRSYDIFITVVLGASVAFVGILLSSGSRDEVFSEMLETNADYIRRLRKQGKSDDYIAEDFLRNMGSRKGVVHGIAKKKVLRFLNRFE